MSSNDPIESLAELSRSWNDNLEQAFAAPPTRPEQYQRVLRLVGAIADALRASTERADDLVDQWVGRADLLAGLVANDARLSTRGLAVDPLLGAGFAIRLRELTEADQAAARLAAVRGRRGWVVLGEDGYAPGDPLVPYYRIEVDAASGAGVHVATEPDEIFEQTVHSVTPMQLDLDTGRLEFDLANSLSFADAEAREAHAAELKSRINPTA